jgi:hypothetical protein
MGGRPVSDIFDMFGGEDEEKPVALVAPKKVVTKVAAEVVTTVAVEPPPADTGPRIQPCGHWDWYSAEEHAVSQAKGHCCPGGQQRIVPNWHRLSGQYLRPVPKHVRRSVDHPGGLCCDSEGFYIGEVLNDCQRRLDDRRCIFHRPVVVVPTTTEELEPEPPKVSYKQRQLKKKG